MSRYTSLLRDVDAMAVAIKSSSSIVALTDLQQKLLDAVVNESGKGALLTELAKKSQFRNIHFAKILKAAHALHKKGKVAFDGSMLVGQDFPPTFMQANVSAAKDIGDPKKDKKRKGAITDLVKRATALAEATASAGFPEVGEAVKTVMALSDFIGRMDTAALRLKAAPSGSSEAVEAQKLIDALRVSADTMIPPLAVTLETLENLTNIAAEMEAQFAAMSAQVKALDEKLKKEKARLAAAANAVQNAVKLA